MGEGGFMFFNGISSCLCLLFEIKGNPYSPVGNNERRAILTSHRRRKEISAYQGSFSHSVSSPFGYSWGGKIKRSNNLKNRQANGQIQTHKNVFFQIWENCFWGNSKKSVLKNIQYRQAQRTRSQVTDSTLANLKSKTESEDWLRDPKEIQICRRDLKIKTQC